MIGPPDIRVRVCGQFVPSNLARDPKAEGSALGVATRLIGSQNDWLSFPLRNLTRNAQRP